MLIVLNARLLFLIMDAYFCAGMTLDYFFYIIELIPLASIGRPACLVGAGTMLKREVVILLRSDLFAKMAGAFELLALNIRNL